MLWLLILMLFSDEFSGSFMCLEFLEGLFQALFGRMYHWRRSRRQRDLEELHGPRLRDRKAITGSGWEWQPTVPNWEKRFCYEVGRMPWKKFLDSKRFITLFKDVLNWNDTAGEEAFHDAKERYWAKINGLPCDIPLPDPDMYIDKIDWNAPIDPELMLDLEQNSKAQQRKANGKQADIFGGPLDDQLFYCPTCGDIEYSTGWEDTVPLLTNRMYYSTGWGGGGPELKTGFTFEKPGSKWQQDSALSRAPVGVIYRRDVCNRSGCKYETVEVAKASRGEDVPNSCLAWKNWEGSSNKFPRAPNASRLGEPGNAAGGGQKDTGKGKSVSMHEGDNHAGNNEPGSAMEKPMNSWGALVHRRSTGLQIREAGNHQFSGVGK
ncbi:uncharacterized protein LOC127789187 [Diospyros lotus]|uniref:uncharacterized protein LOC127789187 n=1 Tax=Diospyros lotus TaxID=55363 RepID=UPI00224E34F0|nr:uncharacterized protein LOC127789187 [Diospyros lotus]